MEKDTGHWVTDITSPVSSKAKNLDEIINELKVTKVSERSGQWIMNKRMP